MCNFCRKCFIISIIWRQVWPQRDAGRPGQGRKINHQVRFGFASPGARVAQNQASFRIRIVNFDA